MKNRKVYLVGNYRSPNEQCDILGVFTSVKKAEKACTKRTHFVGPLTLNERLPDDVEMWTAAYYPWAR